jgi:hypothetical protein
MVNVDWIKEVASLLGGALNVRLKDGKGTDLTVARDRAREFKTWVGCQLPLSAAYPPCSPHERRLKQIRVFQLHLEILGYGRTMITPTIPNSSCSTHLY